MSIRIGNDFYLPSRLSSGNSGSLRNTGSIKNTSNTNNLRAANGVNSANSTASFASALSASMLSAMNGSSPYGGSTLYNNLNSLYSGLNYNIFDASGISQSNWARNDFPLESFFGNNLNSSILNWLPRGIEPAANSYQVMSRLNPTLGMKAIIISPELESKVNSDPSLADSVMNKISDFIKNSDAETFGKKRSDTLIFDKNGEISHYRTFIEGEGLLKPSDSV